MKIDALINWFLHPDYTTNNNKDLRRARLLVSACLLTSFFSTSYVLLSIVFSYDKGIYFTAFNVIGYFTLPFFVRTRLPLLLLGNIYTAIGATTVLALTWFSGGMWSAIYPWIIAIPVLALLIAGRTSAVYWSLLSLLCMMIFGVMELKGISLPIEYNVELRTLWFLCIIPGLLLIIMVVSMTFESSMLRAMADVEAQKTTIEKQSVELGKLIEDKDNIIGILAHDLRNPLTSIGILTTMLADETNDGEKKKIMEMIGKASANAQALVKNVLEMAALEQAGASIKLQPIAAPSIIHEVVQSQSSAAESKGIQITVKRGEVAHKVLADPTYFHQVIENLISNALKFSNSGQQVEVSITHQQRHIQIRVRDYGPGVPTTEEAKLFKKFSRLSARPTAGETSSGLGLSLVKRYMELMNGRVWHERPTDKGAIFAVEFLKA
jgi:signal transduction histidine kinase